MRAFWAANKTVLPLHYGVYVAEVACKKAAAANVETVFSGAGKFTDEAPSTGAALLSRIVKLHYNWKYEFLQPTLKEVIKRATTTSSAPLSQRGTPPPLPLLPPKVLRRAPHRKPARRMRMSDSSRRGPLS